MKIAPMKIHWKPSRPHLLYGAFTLVAFLVALRLTFPADAVKQRIVLEAASLLHDVGQLVSYRKHHKHSYQLIMHAERLGLSARDRALVALISRYHRRTGPRRKHPEFAAFERSIVNLYAR